MVGYIQPAAREIKSNLCRRVLAEFLLRLNRKLTVQTIRRWNSIAGTNRLQQRHQLLAQRGEDCSQLRGSRVRFVFINQGVIRAFRITNRRGFLAFEIDNLL